MTKLLPFLLLLLSFTSAEIKTVKISSNSQPVILFERFGFTNTGQATISISSFSVQSSFDEPDPTRLGFFLLSDESLNQVLLELQSNPYFCVLNSKHVLFFSPSLAPSSSNYSFSVTSPDDYSLFFANCNTDSSVSMQVHTELYNLDRHGLVKDYLSAGFTQLPSLYLLFSLTFFALFVLWCYNCSKNMNSVHSIHLLIAILVFTKALSLLTMAEDKRNVKLTGTPHEGDVLFYVFKLIRIALLLSVIALIGTMWSYLKPGKENKVFMIVILLQILANVVTFLIGETTGPFMMDWVIWIPVSMLVEFMCCFAIIFRIVWSIRSLRKTSKTDGDGKVARDLVKLIRFRKVYLVVIGYLYLTRIVVIVVGSVSSYKYWWVAIFVEELAGLLFFAVILYMFRPIEKNGYFVLHDND